MSCLTNTRDYTQARHNSFSKNAKIIIKLVKGFMLRIFALRGLDCHSSRKILFAVKSKAYGDIIKRW